MSHKVKKTPKRILSDEESDAAISDQEDEEVRPPPKNTSSKKRQVSFSESDLDDDDDIELDGNVNGNGNGNGNVDVDVGEDEEEEEKESRKKRDPVAVVAAVEPKHEEQVQSEVKESPEQAILNVENALAGMTPVPKSKKRKTPGTGNITNYSLFGTHFKENDKESINLPNKERQALIAKRWANAPEDIKKHFTELAVAENRKRARARGEDPDAPIKRPKKKPSSEAPAKKRAKTTSDEAPCTNPITSTYEHLPAATVGYQVGPVVRATAFVKRAYDFYKESVYAEMRDNRKHKHLQEQDLNNEIHAQFEMLPAAEANFFKTLEENHRRKVLSEHYGSSANGMTFIGGAPISVRLP